MANTIKSRVLLKTDTTANWEKATNFIPKVGEVCIYSDRFQLDDGTYVPGIKVGDGTSYISELEFMGDEYITNEEIDEILGSSAGNNSTVETCTLTFPNYSDSEYSEIASNTALTVSSSTFYYTTLEDGSIVRRTYNLYDLFFNGAHPIGCSSKTITVVKGTSISIYGSWFENTFIPSSNYYFSAELASSIASPIYSYSVNDNITFTYDGPL